MFKKIKKVTLALTALFVGALAWAAAEGAGAIKEARSWDFTKGGDHATEVADNENWSESSKGRYALAVDLVDQELPGKDGKALTGLEGIYFTVGQGAVYGITQNFMFQNSKITARIPNCAAGDKVTIDFSGAGSEATLSSDNLADELKSTAKSRGEGTAQTTTVKEDGDVVINMSCSKGFRLYAISVEPAAEAEPQPVAFQDFELILNNENGTLLTAEETVDQTDYAFSIAVEDGKVVRVADDAANAIATVSGKYWNDHGSVNVKVVTKVDGPVKVTFGNCTFYGGVYSIATAEGKTISTDPSEKACWKGSHASTTELVYDGEATTLTISASSYCPYIKVAAYEPPAEPVVFRDFAVQVNNQEGTMLTAEEQVQGTEFGFGVAVDKDGNASRVAVDAANALAVVSGKYHSDHGSNNLKVVVPVDGKTKILFGNCTYNGGKFKVTPKGGETVEIEASEANCWKNGHESVTEYVYDGDATVLVVEGNSYTPYIAFEAIKSTAGSAYDNVAGTLSWTNGNESNATASASVEAAILETSVRVGSNLSVSGPKTYDQIPEAKTPIMSYLCGENPGADPSVMVEYKVKVKKGLTFTPSDVEFDLVKEGTDNAYITWSYTVDGVESEKVPYSSPKTQIRRNNNANPDAPLTHNEKITADGGREFTLRFYISNAANKGMGIGNIKINGTVNGVEEVRAFQNIAINFQSDPYTVRKPEGGLPEGVVVGGTFHDGQHGYQNATITLPVDGPVKMTIGNCAYNGSNFIVKKDGEVIADVNCVADCNSTTTWYYNSEEPAVLDIALPQYCPSFAAEACELLPMFEVSYFDTDGKLLSKEDVQGGSNLEFKYKAEDLKIGEGEAFRGWFNSDKVSATKVKEGTMVQDNLKLYARATAIEVPTSTSRFIYDLTKPYFYVEDHEAIEIEGKYYNTHGWLINRNGTIKVQVAGKAYITVANCLYSAESTATATDEAGNVIAEFPVKATGDGAEYTFTYDGNPGWVTITFPEGAYTHSVAVENVVDFVAYDEATGYYIIPAGDVSSLLIALKAASGKEGTKIFLPNGVYDLGETVLTGVSGKNVSIIGESMEGTIIVNAPLLENEGIGQTATIKNSCDGLYMQDLTLRNAMKFTGATGRAVALQDCGTRTICKNVSLESYQDTYYSNNNNGDFYFEDGEIHGVVDYVCGGGDVFYNRVKFVNESIKNTTIAAPASAKKFGYVMMNCTIETLCNEFNYGRSWQNPSRLAWINTTINQPNKLAKSRFTIGGMNVAADKFVEYNTMDKDGNVISPASNVIEFTHSTGNKTYETILTAEEAAGYAIDKVFPDWRAEEIAAQAVYTPGEDLTGNVYLVDGKVYAGEIPADAKLVRKANERGGFGPAVEVNAVAKNTLLTAGDYTVTGKVTADAGDPLMNKIIESAFSKYLENNGEYKGTCTLVGDENELVIGKNSDDGIFAGYSIIGDAVTFSPENSFTISGYPFTIGTIDGETTGKLLFSATAEENKVALQSATIFYKGKKVGTVENIIFVKDTNTAISTATFNGKTVNGIYNLAGQRVGNSYTGAKIIVYTDGTTVKVAK